MGYRRKIGETVPKRLVIDLLSKQAGQGYLSTPAADFTFIDLFAGIGSLRMGFELIDGRCIYTSEWDPACPKTYHANFCGVDPV